MTDKIYKSNSFFLVSVFNFVAKSFECIPADARFEFPSIQPKIIATMRHIAINLSLFTIIGFGGSIPFIIFVLNKIKRDVPCALRCNADTMIQTDMQRTRTNYISNQIVNKTPYCDITNKMIHLDITVLSSQ